MFNVNFGESGVGWVIVDGVGLVIKVGFMQQEGEGGCEEDKQCKFKRECFLYVFLVESGKVFWIVVECLIV